MAGRTKGEKIERKYLAHFIDAGFGGASNWVRLGKDLEEYNIEMNPEIETKKNILGESSSGVKGYEPQATLDTYYAYEGDPLYEQLFSIVNNRSTGSQCVTKVCDVLLNTDGTIVSAWQEDAIVVPTSVGGGTEGMNIPFEVHYSGSRKDVTSTATIKDGKLTVSASA